MPRAPWLPLFAALLFLAPLRLGASFDILPNDLAGNRLTAVYNAGGGDALTLTSSYDALNRLAGVADGTRTSSYGYDAAGRRSAGLCETVRTASFCD